VTEAFARFAVAIAAKEHISHPQLDHRVAASAGLPDGAVATLWVASSTTARSRCYHLDVTAPDGYSANGSGACQAPDEKVTLNRAGVLIVGSVGTQPATSVRVSGRSGIATLPVTAGYFLVPPTLSPGLDESYSVTLVGSDGTMLGEVADLHAPGGAVPTRT
jgi:hypothetical protein